MSRCHIARHRSGGRAPQMLRFIGTVLIVAGVPLTIFALFIDTTRTELAIVGPMMLLLGVIDHVAANLIEDDLTAEEDAS